MDLMTAIKDANFINVEWRDMDYRIESYVQSEMVEGATMPCVYAYTDGGIGYEFTWDELIAYNRAGDLQLFKLQSIEVTA